MFLTTVLDELSGYQTLESPNQHSVGCIELHFVSKFSIKETNLTTPHILYASEALKPENAKRLYEFCRDNWLRLHYNHKAIVSKQKYITRNSNLMRYAEYCSLYRVSQKSSPLRLSTIFSLGLSLFA